VHGTGAALPKDAVSQHMRDVQHSFLMEPGLSAAVHQGREIMRRHIIHRILFRCPPRHPTYSVIVLTTYPAHLSPTLIESSGEM